MKHFTSSQKINLNPPLKQTEISQSSTPQDPSTPRILPIGSSSGRPRPSFGEDFEDISFPGVKLNITNYHNIDVLRELSRFVHDNFPINVLSVPDMVLHSREDVTAKVAPIVESRLKVGTLFKARLAPDGSNIAEVAAEIREAFRTQVRELKYAILSHRWLSSGELTYEATLKASSPGGSFPDGPGFQKLRRFCGVAEEQGCIWAWADMCCIDKRSSAELDESIRSMYRWYRDAKLCIVHLADTVSLVDIDKDQWFKRGWTLQELLAPTRIMYFTKEWQPLVSDGGENHKKDTDVVNAISEATGIPRYQLRYFKPGVNMIREKMSWARGRRTTKVEDVAYSLLGLFDLTMPIIYGEGEHAFQRLQTTLAGLTNSMDLFIWKDLQHLPTHNIFAPSPDFFPPPTAEENMRDDRFVLWIYSKVQSPKLSCNEHFSGGWTLRQCDTLARTFIHRGDLSFTLTNAGLHISLIMYQYTGFLDSSRGRLSEVNIRDARFAEAKPLDPISVTPTTIPMFSGPGDRKIFVGVLDYDFGDANNEPIVSIEDIYVTQENDKLFIADIEEQDGGRSMIHEGREKRSYAAFLLRSLGLAVRGGSERFQKIGFLTVTRPKEGWKHREKVYVNLR